MDWTPEELQSMQDEYEQLIRLQEEIEHDDE